MGTFITIMLAAFVLTVAIGGLGAGFVFLMDNDSYRNFIKKITH